MPKSASARNKESLKIEKSFTESLRDAIMPIELPDIVTFAENEHFCNKKLYPRQRTLLRLMFLDTEHMTDYDKEVIEEWRNNFFVGEERIGVPPDIWKRIEWCKSNGYTHFREIEFIGGRRGGKGHLGGIIGAYQTYKMIALDSPQWHYGVDPNKDLYCHDDETEVLTQTGWKLFKDVQDDERVGTVSNNGLLEFQLPTYRIEKNFKGKLIESSNGTRFNFSVTPDHDMLVKDWVWNRVRYRKIKAETLLTEKARIPLAPWKVNPQNPTSIVFEGLNKVTDKQFAGFVGFWIAEGTKAASYSSKNVVEISQTKPEGREWLENLLNNMNWPFKVAITKRGEYKYRIYNSELSAYLRNLVIENEVRLPKESFNWGSEAKEALWNGLVLGDGYKNFLFNTSLSLIEDVQRLLLYVGSASSIRRLHEAGDSITVKGKTTLLRKDFYRLSRSTRQFAIVQPSHSKERSYDGKVYCFQVPNGTLVTRKNKRTLVSGNCFVTATNLSQARDYQYKDIAETISNAPCFEKYLSTNKGLSLTLRTPADIRKIAELERRNVPMDREIASIRIVALSSNSRAGRGAATYALFFDEMAHMMSQTEGPNTAEEVYKALTPSLDQMGKEGLIYIPTSPYSKVGQAYNIYQQGITSDANGDPLVPNLLVVQMPSWEPYKDWDNPKIVTPGTYRGAPQTYDEEVRKLEERDPDSFKVERRAQWSEVINSYLNPQIVDKIFDPIKYPDGELRELKNMQPGVSRWIYRGHADPGVSQANFAVAIGHTEPFWDEELKENMFHVVFDYLQVWRPQDFPDHQVDYLAIEEQLVDIITKYPTLKSFSFDQYGGFVTVPYLKSHLRKRGHQARVRQATFTPKSNQIRAERFKSALGMGWVHAPRDSFAADNLSLLELELKFLQLKNGKVVKQDVGPVTTKDLADAVMEVTSELLADQIDRRHNRSALAGGRLSIGAPGGYHSNMDVTSARGRLSAYGSTKGNRETYGQKRW